MLTLFDIADRILILGYRINADDNHINGILRQYLLSEKEIIYLDFDASSSERVILDR